MLAPRRYRAAVVAVLCGWLSGVAAPAHATVFRISPDQGPHPVFKEPPPPPPHVRESSSGVLNIKDFGARGDGFTDDTAAWKAVVAAARAAGGGIIHYPPGTYLITDGAVYINEGSDDQQLIIEGSGSATKILAHRADGVWLQAGNFNQIIIRDLAFVGDLFTDIDVSKLIYVQSGRQLILEHCLFVGVRAANDSQLIFSQADDTVIRECRFLGCAAAGSGSIIQADLGSLVVENSAFFDYGNLGCAFYGKTSYGVGAWIYVNGAAPIQYSATSSQNSLVVRNCRFDEGATTAILLAPLAFVRYDRVDLEDLVIYAQAAIGGRAISIATAENVEIKRVQIKERQPGNRTIELIDAGDVEIRHSRVTPITANAGIIFADDQTRSLSIIRSFYSTLQSAAGETNAGPAH